MVNDKLVMYISYASFSNAQSFSPTNRSEQCQMILYIPIGKKNKPYMCNVQQSWGIVDAYYKMIDNFSSKCITIAMADNKNS